jgi:hypothetical protein
MDGATRKVPVFDKELAVAQTQLAKCERRVNVPPLLATFAADWDPFGVVFWVALAVGMIGALLVSPLSRLPVHVRSRILLLLPGIMALGCSFTRWINSRSAAFLGPRYFYEFYFAELDAAFTLFVAFGAGFSIAALRACDRRCRVMGGVFGLVFLALIGAVYIGI